MGKVNLREQKSEKLTVVEGDESLKHLSRITEVSSATQLNTGGRYRSSGNHALVMPADGSYVEILVVSGAATLTGTVDGVVNPVIQTGPMRRYAKSGGVWQTLGSTAVSGGGLSNFVTLTSSGTASVDNPLIWFDNAFDAVLTLPAGLPENTTFGVVRGNDASVTVDPSGSEGIRDPVTNTPNTDGVFLNVKRRVLWLKKGPTHWSTAT